jgi:hypothetical protein
MPGIIEVRPIWNSSLRVERRGRRGEEEEGVVRW